MVRGKRPVRGGKRKFDERRDASRKKKKGKFDIREASYVKERDAKNAEIESRRKRLNEQKDRRGKIEAESSSAEEDEENFMNALLATLPKAKKPERSAIESESEEDSSEEEDAKETKEEIDSHESEGESVEPEGDGEDEDAESGEPRKSEDEKVDEDEEDAETSREDAGHLRDPFSIHLNRDLSDALYRSISSNPPVTKTHDLNFPILGKLRAEIPVVPAGAGFPADDGRALLLSEEKRRAEPPGLPRPPGRTDFDELFVKSQIRENVALANEKMGINSRGAEAAPLTSFQSELFAIMNNYQDLLYTEKTSGNSSEIRFAYCLHAVNHALKTRTKVLHHNAKLARSARSSNATAEVPEEYRDQGLARPRILIVAPFRSSCLKIVETIVAILIGEDRGGSVINKKRFLEDFTGNEISMPRRNRKPEDYEATFAGNTDDTYRIGLSITKRSLKLYADFYSSDVIISSVLGLRMIVGAEGEEERDYDFLASVELLIIDEMEILAMQNWDHLVHVLEHFHLQPRSPRDVDFSRVRSWCVNGWSRYYRQSLLFSSINTPEIQGVFNGRCRNYAGKLRSANPPEDAAVCRVLVQVPQYFRKFRATDPARATLDGRFDVFLRNILPQFLDPVMNHTLVYVPSYFDFVKLRNHLKNEDASFAQVCEYSKDSKVARARDMFFHSDAHFLLYSERFHFFRRVRVKGVRHLVFFAPPTFPHFYDEMCNLMQEANQNPRAGSESNMSVTTIYSKYDALRIAPILGTERTIGMLASDKDVHMIITGDS